MELFRFLGYHNCCNPADGLRFFMESSCAVKIGADPTISLDLFFVLQLVPPIVRADESRPVVLAMRLALGCLGLTLLMGSLNLAQYSGC